MRSPGLGALFLLVGLTACDSDPLNAPAGTRFEPLFSTLYSNIRVASQAIIRDSASWAQVWGQISAGGTAAAPRVDFREEEVVLVTLGERRRAGYQIRIETIQYTDARRTVAVVTTAPAENCSGAEVITTPLDAARASRTSKPTVFTERLLIIPC